MKNNNINMVINYNINNKSKADIKKVKKLLSYHYLDKFFCHNFGNDEQENCYFITNNYFVN